MTLKDLLQPNSEVPAKYDVTQPSILSCIGKKGIRRATVITDCAYTITCRQDRTPTQVIKRPDGRYRFLTERECWRLMGFTDSDFDAADLATKLNGLYKRELYKQAGNSMPVPVLESIFNTLFEEGYLVKEI